MSDTPPPITFGQDLEILKARVRLIEEMVTEIRRDIARVATPNVAVTPVDIAIRDPAVWAEELRTGMRG
jgi:hypothetical protein